MLIYAMHMKSLFVNRIFARSSRSFPLAIYIRPSSRILHLSLRFLFLLAIEIE